MAGSTTWKNLGRAAATALAAALAGYVYGNLKRPPRADRRSGLDRRVSARPVQIDRRSGGDRRTGRDRRSGWERRLGPLDSSTYG
jgi:hypothetical protein